VIQLDLPALLLVCICEAQKQLTAYEQRQGNDTDSESEPSAKRARTTKAPKTNNAAAIVDYSLVMRYAMLRCRSFNFAVRSGGESVFQRAVRELVDTGLIWKVKKPQLKMKLTKSGHDYVVHVYAAVAAAAALFDANTTKEELHARTMADLEQFAIVNGIRKAKKSELVRNVLAFLQSGKVSHSRSSSLARLDYGLMRWITNDDRFPDEDDSGKLVWDGDPAVPIVARPLIWDGPMYDEEENSDTDTFMVLSNVLARANDE